MDLRSADPELTRTWRRARRASLISLVVDWLLWLVGLLLVLLDGGSFPLPESLKKQKGSWVGDGPRAMGGAFLLLHQTTAWPGQRQVDVRSSPDVRLRRGRAWLGGVLQVDERGLFWTPSSRWRSDAREFLISWTDVARVRMIRGRRMDGIVADLISGGQVWFAARLPDLRTVIEKLGHAELRVGDWSG
jgi:hypothetical protein